jgi:PAS domain S-box-containing protein
VLHQTWLQNLMPAASMDERAAVPNSRSRTANTSARRGLSLRWRLAWLVTAGVVPLLAFSLALQYQEYRREVANTGQQTLALARSMSLLVDEELKRRVAALETLTLSRFSHDGDVETFRQTAESVLTREFPGSKVVLVRQDDQQLMNALTPSDGAQGARELRQAFKTGQPIVSDVFTGAADRTPVVAIDVPVKDADGTVAYVLSMTPLPRAIAGVIDRQAPRHHWIFTVVDRSGVTIARVPNGEEFIGHPASPGLLGHLVSEPEGIVETISPDGVPLLSAFSHSGQYGWGVSIGVPMAELRGPAASAGLRTLAIGGLLFAVGLGFALYGARQIARPIASLRRLAAGTEGAMLDSGTGLRETDEVADALIAAEADRRSAEREARILRAGIDTISAGFVIYDERDRLVICNESYRNFFPDTAGMLVPGVGYEDIVRDAVAKGRYPAAKGREEEWIAERFRQQRESRDLVEQHLSDGRWVLVSKSLMPDDYVASLRIDISALKAAEQALMDSEERLRRAQRLAQMGSDLRDLRTDRTEWSDETYRIFGVKRETFTPSTKSLLRVVYPEDRAKILTAIDQVSKGICPEPFEYRIVRPDGSVRYIYRENELVLDETGAPRYVAGTIHDITERRRTEEQLRQSQKMEAIGNLTGGMAHDFNNLLAIIVGNLDLARDLAEPGGELREVIQEALEAAWHGADLTRRLLAFARRQPLRPEEININDLATDTLKLLRRLLGEDIDVVLDLGDHIWTVNADPAQLEAAITNLATNARDAMPKGGRLIITTANRFLDADYAASHADVAPGDYVMIEVSDTGGGMPPDVVNQIFEPFFTTKEPGKGTGLGLSMVFGFLRQSAGHINVYSEPGVGTTFRLYLPRVNRAGAQAETPNALPVARGAGETVLVVEDNAGVRRVVVRHLEELGYRVLECDHGAAALEILRNEKVTLLFTDVVMPGGLDGVELAGLAWQRWPDLKIVLTSGFPQARVNENGDVPGKLQLLSKPYRKEELADALRAAIDA